MTDLFLHKPRVLVAPLDWGLGHTTRCIPLIRELEAQGAVVVFAGNQVQASLVRQEFPHLTTLELRGYNVKYARTRLGSILGLLWQVPGIGRQVRREHRWLQEAVKEHRIDAVISDNRYGLWTTEIPCAFITHQLYIRTPLGKWVDALLKRANYRYINHFTQCWVPDQARPDNLAGKLSHPGHLPAIPVHYTGPLSRLQADGNIKSIPGHLFISLSGPEPQRTMLEEKIVAGLAAYPGSAVVVRGLPASSDMISPVGSAVFYNHLAAPDFAREMQKAELIISRSGYSTIMDLAVLQKKSILIATPGQSEQEYLARMLREKQVAYSVSQQHFSLQEALEAAAAFPYRPFGPVSFALPGIIQQWLRLIRDRQK